MKRSSYVSTGTSTAARSASTNDVRLDRLRTVLAAQRQRQPDDDALDLVLEHERPQLGEPVLASPPASTTPSGRAIVPVASETATPVRAAP